MIRILFYRDWHRWALVLGVALALLLFSSGGSGSAFAGNGESGPSLVELFKHVSGSVGALYTQSSDGNLSMTCTVTVTDKVEGRTILLTAAHCVARDVSYKVTLDGDRFYSARVWKLPPDMIDPQKYRRGYGEPKVDMALFIVDVDLPVPAIAMDANIVPEPGREIATVGFPLGITKVRYNGILSGRLEQPGSDQQGYLILQIFGAPGSSGSAVIDSASGRIVGVLVSGKQERAGLPVLFATPIGYSKYLKQAAGAD